MAHELRKEYKIDYSKSSEKVNVHFDLSFFNGPCTLLEANYMDIMGTNLVSIPIKKYEIDAERKVSSVQFKENHAYLFNQTKLMDQAEKFPGCRIIATFGVFKAKGEMHFSFIDHYSMYKSIAFSKKLNVHLGFKLNKLYIGDWESHEKVINDLKPYYPLVESDFNPYLSEVEHKYGHFSAIYNLHIFPVEFRSDFHTHKDGKEKDKSFHYSMVENVKPIKKHNKTPDVIFQIEFLPLIKMYHLKMRNFRLWFLTVLGVCGGVLGLSGVVNKLINF